MKMEVVMSIDYSGLKSKQMEAIVRIKINNDHPLIRLSNALPWEKLAEIILPDLKTTTSKSKWWLGRKLKLRIHLAAYILQQLYNKTDRQIEYAIKDNAAYQLFCGRFIVAKWHCPDHTKIEEFRSRLSPETQRIIANKIATVAVSLGFADPSKLDIDSTVQEANMSFPADAWFMVKIAALTKKVANYLVDNWNKRKDLFDVLDEKTRKVLKKCKVDMRLLKRKQRDHFFVRRYAGDSFFAQEQKRNSMMMLWFAVLQETSPIWSRFKHIHHLIADKLPWNIHRSLDQIGYYACNYMMSMGFFITQDIPVKEPLCFHLDNQVACFNKGKLSRKNQYGRSFQLGRIKGNFFFVAKSTDVRMSDKPSLPAVIEMHQDLFGKKKLESFATDRGYFSYKNQELLENLTLKEFRLPKPGTQRDPPLPATEEEEKELKRLEGIQQKLNNRSVGIEPLIGHIKHGGQMGKSRMKNSKTILASGYAAVFGFNLRQLIRCLQGKMPKLVEA
jgi:hypothetical protein